jgi:hypothetical protein
MPIRGPDCTPFDIPAKIEPIKPTINPQRRGEPSWSSRQVAQARNTAI